MQAKYRVTLCPDERDMLLQLVSKGKAAARKLLHARILLKADAAEGAPAWEDEQIETALDAGASTIHRVRQRFVEHGLDESLNPRKPTGRQYRKLDGAQEARLIAQACSPAPEGRSRWTLQLLADQMVELKLVDSLSGECVRTTLKKRTEAMAQGAMGAAAGTGRGFRMRDGGHLGGLPTSLRSRASAQSVWMRPASSSSDMSRRRCRPCQAAAPEKITSTRVKGRSAFLCSLNRWPGGAMFMSKNAALPSILPLSSATWWTCITRKRRRSCW